MPPPQCPLFVYVDCTFSLKQHIFGNLESTVDCQKDAQSEEPLNRLFASSWTYCAFHLEVSFCHGTGYLASRVSIWYAYYLQKVPSCSHLIPISFWNPSDTNWSRNLFTSAIFGGKNGTSRWNALYVQWI